MQATAVGAARNRIISCIHWAGSSVDVVLGLKGGDLLLIKVQDEGKTLVLLEHALKDAPFLQNLWSGIMKSNVDKDTIALCSVILKESVFQKDINGNENIILSVSSEGMLRAWNARSKKCTIQVSLSQLLEGSLTFDDVEGKQGRLKLSFSMYCVL
jgi:WD40 repeat protein